MARSLTFACVQWWFEGCREIPEAYAARFARCRNVSRDSMGPVDGVRGCLASAQQDAVVRYDRAVQRWEEVDDGVWIGVDRAFDPSLLLRDEVKPGREVVMGDGNVWLIPVANPLVETCRLPVWHRLNRKKQWEKVLQDEWRALGRRAGDLAGYVVDQIREKRSPDVVVDDDQMRALIADCLAINYDVTIEELSVLRVFAPEAYWPAVCAVIDFETLAQVVLASMEGADGGVPPFAGSDGAGIMPGGGPD